MPFRPLILLGLITLLTACASDNPAPTLPTTPAPSQTPMQTAPLPAYQRELSGSLLGVPAAADVELALLAVDPRGRPQALLGNIQLRGNGGALPFRLPFNPDTFNQHPRIELHGRAHQAGRLILRLPPQPIRRAETQALGSLHLVPAP
ncbi:MAG TPA: hypothetical protein VFY62_17700 [Pseudomonas sp.]|nr:hypothetical protein [Pseudomonas sp.]